MKSALLVLLGIVSLSACQRRAATRADCEAILGRIVAIELGELGYRDPALLQLKQRELSRRFATDIQACVGHPLAASAVGCVSRATSTEAISHRCLR